MSFEYHILWVDRCFSGLAKSFNEEKEISLPKIDKFVERIIGHEAVRSDNARKHVVQKIESAEARETLSYLVGISKVVPQLISEELKLKYELLRMIAPTREFKIEPLLDAYSIPEKDKPNEIAKAKYKELNGVELAKYVRRQVNLKILPQMTGLK